jgi:hypothetical protein
MQYMLRNDREPVTFRLHMRLQDTSIHNDVSRAKIRRLKQEAVCAMALFSGGLLRATDDLKVWKDVQAATLLIGIALI